jgi:hypothetical protein
MGHAGRRRQAYERLDCGKERSGRLIERIAPGGHPDDSQLL